MFAELQNWLQTAFQEPTSSTMYGLIRTASARAGTMKQESIYIRPESASFLPRNVPTVPAHSSYTPAQTIFLCYGGPPSRGFYETTLHRPARIRFLNHFLSVPVIVCPGASTKLDGRNGAKSTMKKRSPSIRASIFCVFTR